MPEKTVNVSALHIHRDYDRNGNTENDVALLELAEDVDLNTYTPACMAEVLAHLVYVLYYTLYSIILQSTDTEAFYGKTVQVYGWGDTKFGSRNGSNVLLETNVTVVTPEVCQDTLDTVCDEYFNGKYCTNLTDGMLCAGSPGKDSCQVSTPLNAQNI